MEITMCIEVYLISWMNFDYKENGGKKAFLANPKQQYRVSNVENIIVMPITKRMKIVMRTQVYLISKMNFDYEKNGGKKAFLANPKHQIKYPNGENMFVMLITKRTEIVMSIQVCLISWMNFNYEENGGKKAFLANPKHQYHVSQ